MTRSAGCNSKIFPMKKSKKKNIKNDVPVEDGIPMYKPGKGQKLFHRSTAKYKLIGGAMGGGKSKALCMEALNLSATIRGNRGAIIRKNLTTLRRTTMVTFFQSLSPGSVKEISKTEFRVTLNNGSEILFLDADESKDMLFDKLKSLELGWFAIDEASEVSKTAFQILVSRLRWKAAEGKYFGLLASNPEQCWVKEEFIDAKKPRKYPILYQMVYM